MKLSHEQVDVIRKHVDQSAINIESLRDDVLDHLCCVVEIKIERGNSFERSVHEALTELAPEGLDEIQNETVFLLNSTKILRMKKVMYLIGLITAISMSFGVTFKILHWTGGDELLIYGMIGFVFLYLPLLMVNHFKLSINSALTEKLRLILGFVSALAICTAIALKVLHIAGADLLLIVGTLLFSFGFLPFMFFNMYKKSIS
jgi:hypothetical protein